MALNVRSNIMDNLGKGIHLSMADAVGVPEPLKAGFYQAHTNFVHGTCLEFGVMYGNSFMWQILQILNFFPKDQLIGFDSWQGLPKETPGVWAPERHHEGAFSTTKDVVIGRMEEYNVFIGDRFKLVDGFFSKSLTPELQSVIGEGDSKVIFINVDVDIHSSAMEVLRWVRPLLQVGTVLYFDDWKDPIDTHDGPWGEHLAWAQWTKENPSIQAKLVSLNDVNQRAFEITAL